MHAPSTGQPLSPASQPAKGAGLEGGPHWVRGWACVFAEHAPTCVDADHAEGGQIRGCGAGPAQIQRRPLVRLKQLLLVHVVQLVVEVLLLEVVLLEVLVAELVVHEAAAGAGGAVLRAALALGRRRGPGTSGSAPGTSRVRGPRTKAIHRDHHFTLLGSWQKVIAVGLVHRWRWCPCCLRWLCC